MRGTSAWQISAAFSTIDSIGEQSKHSEKAEARESGRDTWATMDLDVHGVATNNQYQSVGVAMAEFVKEEWGVRDIEKITGAQVEQYMRMIIDTRGRDGNTCARSTANVYHAALAKVELAINTFAKNYNARDGHDPAKDKPMRDWKIKGTPENQAQGSRAYAIEQCGRVATPDRAYTDPKAIVGAISGKHQLFAKALFESGARISELSKIRQESLRGIKTDKHTHEQRGLINVRGKGGKYRMVAVTPQTYREIVSAVAAAGGKASWSENNYREKLHSAAFRTNQAYTGAHGSRHNWGRERMATLQAHGLSYQAALGSVSRSMGHERSDITEVYLGLR